MPNGSQPLCLPSFVLPPCFLCLFLCRTFELCSALSPFLHSPSLQIQILQGAQPKAWQLTETFFGSQCIYSLLLPDFAPWGLTPPSQFILCFTSKQKQFPSQEEIYQQLREENVCFCLVDFPITTNLISSIFSITCSFPGLLISWVLWKKNAVLILLLFCFLKISVGDEHDLECSCIYT